MCRDAFHIMKSLPIPRPSWLHFFQAACGSDCLSPDWWASFKWRRKPAFLPDHLLVWMQSECVLNINRDLILCSSATERYHFTAEDKDNVYVGFKWCQGSSMLHTHQPSSFNIFGSPCQTCIMNCCKAWELLMCLERDVGFSNSRQVKLHHPETRRNQKYLTGKHPHPKISLLLLCCSLCFVFIFSTDSIEIPPG